MHEDLYGSLIERNVAHEKGETYHCEPWSKTPRHPMKHADEGCSSVGGRGCEACRCGKIGKQSLSQMRMWERDAL
jgi:hypothetical protein